MYTAAVDVNTLPIGWNSSKGVSEELFQETQKMAQLTSMILVSTITLWEWSSRTLLRAPITNYLPELWEKLNCKDLFEFIKKLP